MSCDRTLARGNETEHRSWYGLNNLVYVTMNVSNQDARSNWIPFGLNLLIVNTIFNEINVGLPRPKCDLFIKQIFIATYIGSLIKWAAHRVVLPMGSNVRPIIS